VSKAIADHIKTGEDYTHVRKVYHINIVYFELGQGADYVYHGSTSFRGIHLGDELRLTPEQQAFFGKKTVPKLYPEYYILMVKDFDGYAKDSLDEWIYYLKNDAIPESFTAPGLREARERLLVDSLSPSERAAYEAHLMHLSHVYSIMQTAKAEGRAEGEDERKKLQEALEIKEKNLVEKDEAHAKFIANAVKTLAGQGMSLQQIAQILQLDVEEAGKYLVMRNN
jgi:predicted transposase/invertase (TIGR01784 family)